MLDQRPSVASPDPTAYLVELQDLVLAAERHITVVNWPAGESSHSGIQQARRAHLGHLLTMAGRGLLYERILQVPPDVSIANAYDGTYNEHFRQMADTSRGNLMVAGLTVPITFAIIDDQHLAVEINVVDGTKPGSVAWRPDGAFILRNAASEVLAPFHQLVVQLRTTSDMVTAWPPV
jgi:hypothetical protein